jgi:hypothetical protein
VSETWKGRISIAATVVGLVTALIALVGWIATKSVRDALSIALPLAGAVYLVGLLLGELSMVAVAVRKGARATNPSERKVARDGAKAFGVVLIIVMAVAAWVLFSGDRRENLLLFAIVGLASTAFFGVVLVRTNGREQRAAQEAADRAAYDAAHKTCPDCCEAVKAEASVCRHCGWRFAPPPPIVPSAAERTDPVSPGSAAAARPSRRSSVLP